MEKREKEERRTQQRVQQTVVAQCLYEGRGYEAHTSDISQKGMTLLTSDDFPKATYYSVTCELPSGTKATFEVEERYRRLMKDRPKPYLRLGVYLLNESWETVKFFQELAELLLEQTHPDINFHDPNPS